MFSTVELYNWMVKANKQHLIPREEILRTGYTEFPFVKNLKPSVCLVFLKIL